MGGSMKRDGFAWRSRIGNVACFSLCVGTMLALPVEGNGLHAENNSQDSNQVHLHVGQPAPAFTVHKLGGGEVSLTDYKGKVILVNFWATWCGACKLEMPWLAQLRQKYASQGFEVLGIVTDNAPAAKIDDIAQKYGVKYPILMCNHRTAQAYGGIEYLPASFYIARNGKVVIESSESTSKDEIEADILKTIAFGVKH
jgi:thiol-disulfide isomerase/thioredoxin